MKRFVLGFFSLCLLRPAAAQLAPPNEAGVSLGHLHLNVKDVEAQKAFWLGQMGGVAVPFGAGQAVKFPGVLIMFRKGDPAGGTEGSVIDHIGFLVPNVKDFLARRRAAGVKVFNEQPTQGFIEAPEGIKIEIQQDPAQTVPIKSHHIHFQTPSIEETRAWYVKLFAAKSGTRGRFQAADLPGVNLTFTQAQSDRVGTKGRSLDHIGFEVKNLEAFCKQLEAQGVKFDTPYRKVANIGLAIAFLTDPWGTYIELTEGLNKL